MMPRGRVRSAGQGLSMTSHARGFAVVDLVVACAIVGVVGAIALPALHATRDRDAVRMAARYLAQRMQYARLEALKRNAEVALRFDPDEVGLVGAFADGDGDGVLQRDIDAGTDHRLSPDARLGDTFDGVVLQIASDVPDPDGGSALGAGSDAVRIGSTNFLSFSPLGSSTSGTIYLAGRGGQQACVRILGATGRTRVLWFNPATRQWQQG
jgi:Tfp pilus assembly protein FimT